MPTGGSITTRRSANSLERWVGSRVGRERPTRAAWAMLSTRRKTRSSLRAPMPRLQKAATCVQSFSMVGFKSSGSPTELCEVGFNAWHINRNKSAGSASWRCQNLIEPQQSSPTQAQAGGLVTNCATRSMPTSRSGQHSFVQGRSAATGRLAIASGARPRRDNCLLAEHARHGPRAARCVGERRPNPPREDEAALFRPRSGASNIRRW